MILHTLNKPPSHSDAYQRCFAVLDTEDALLLLEEGAYAAVVGTAVSATIADLASKGKVFLLAEDFIGRGLKTDRLLPAIQLIGYAEFVALVCQHDKQVAWF